MKEIYFQLKRDRTEREREREREKEREKEREEEDTVLQIQRVFSFASQE